MEILAVGPAGQIELPDAVRDRYGAAPSTPIRLIETRGGILLVPPGDAPMSPELASVPGPMSGLATLGEDAYTRRTLDFETRTRARPGNG
jgi:bifunctional DNA-binding transcriptional regulator/antitoxin component of YhaV-PrlF toxin-antitoxin module